MWTGPSKPRPCRRRPQSPRCSLSPASPTTSIQMYRGVCGSRAMLIASQAMVAQFHYQRGDYLQAYRVSKRFAALLLCAVRALTRQRCAPVRAQRGTTGSVLPLRAAGSRVLHGGAQSQERAVSLCAPGPSLPSTPASLREPRSWSTSGCAAQLVEAYADLAISWFAVGCYYLLVGKFVDARRFFSKATQIDPQFAPAWIGFGECGELSPPICPPACVCVVCVCVCADSARPTQATPTPVRMRATKLCRRIGRPRACARAPTSLCFSLACSISTRRISFWCGGLRTVQPVLTRPLLRRSRRAGHSVSGGRP
jgi:hypothetical protein